MKLPIVLKRNGTVSLKQQLYQEIRQLILSGHWPVGHKLPSSRTLAEKLNISRPTINWAFTQLLNEGYIQTYIGLGTFVSRELPDNLVYAPKSVSNYGEEKLTSRVNQSYYPILVIFCSQKAIRLMILNNSKLILEKHHLLWKAFQPRSGKSF